METKLEDFNPEKLLNNIDQLEAFRYYLDKHVEIGVSFSNPLRPPDDPDVHPSANLKWYSDRLMLLDFGNSNYNMDIIKAVMIRESLDYKSAIIKLREDSINLAWKANERTKVVQYDVIAGIAVEMEIEFQPYTQVDINYWEQQGLSITTVHKGKIKSCFRYRTKTNDKWSSYTYYLPGNPMYCYLTESEGIYKIYRPYAAKEDKFRFNGSRNDIPSYIEGITELPHSGEKLIICKSRKDRLYLKQRGFTCISVQGEGISIPDKIIEDLKRRFKKVIVFFDRDKQGMSKVINFYWKKHRIYGWFIPKHFRNVKDVTEFHSVYKEKMVEQVILKQLREL